MSINIRTTFGRTAMIAAATGFAALALAGTASAEVIDRNIGVADCQQPQTQMCNPAQSVSFTTDGPFMVEFEASGNHCSDMVAHVAVDGNPWSSNVVGSGQRDGGYFVETGPGTHTVGVQAEGIPGGCNEGFVGSWAGTLHIETGQDAENGRG